MTDSDEIYRLHNAEVKREGTTILNVDDFVLKRGETLVVLGPNGSGKSTLINILTREILPLYREEPPIRIYGQDRIIVSDMRKLIGVVSGVMQEQISVQLPVIDIVLGGFFGTLGLTRTTHVEPWMERKALQALAELGIADLKDRLIPTLSTGQARRVLVARAIIHDPEVLVFDEPCSGLDPQAMYHVRTMLSSLADMGKTLILVTHHVEDIVPQFTRVALVKNARLIADGPKEEVLTSQNLQDLFEFPLELTEKDGRYHIWERF